jgi:hypothetical protein
MHQWIVKRRISNAEHACEAQRPGDVTELLHLMTIGAE